VKNVILLTIDAVRKDVFGCYGNKQGLTPFIDSLQDKCIRFTRSQASGPYTQASFPGILTSSYYLEYGKPRGLSARRTLILSPLRMLVLQPLPSIQTPTLVISWVRTEAGTFFTIPWRKRWMRESPT